MAMPNTILSVADPLTLSDKKLWEDPGLTLERALQVNAQGGPPAGGPPDAGPDRGFLGPLSVSAGQGTGFC